MTRGIDFKGVRTIINFGLPSSVAGYVHRVGRTGAGAAPTFTCRTLVCLHIKLSRVTSPVLVCLQTKLSRVTSPVLVCLQNTSPGSPMQVWAQGLSFFERTTAALCPIFPFATETSAQLALFSAHAVSIQRRGLDSGLLCCDNVRTLTLRACSGLCSRCLTPPSGNLASKRAVYLSA